jgi:hypothetical protein
LGESKLLYLGKLGWINGLSKKYIGKGKVNGRLLKYYFLIDSLPIRNRNNRYGLLILNDFTKKKVVRLKKGDCEQK